MPTPLAVAVEAVRLASTVCRAVQQRLITPETIQKKDKSPVTVADFASQAVVASVLKKHLPGDVLVGEEDARELRTPEQAAALRVVVEQVRSALGDVSDDDVLGLIDHGGGTPTPTGRFWTLDPIDGTKGFLRREQFAVALALIEDGKVILGALACPNLPAPQPSSLEPQGPPARGIVLTAERSRGARMASLWDDRAAWAAVRTSDIADTSEARFCESVESGHSDQGASAQIARALGITAEPVRMDSQAKYAVVAQGQAQIYLRLPTRADYRECIWDHAAGSIVVEEAGGRVTDVDGKPLDFSQGRRLTNNRGIIATSGRIHDRVVGAVRAGQGLGD